MCDLRLIQTMGSCFHYIHVSRWLREPKNCYHSHLFFYRDFKRIYNMKSRQSYNIQNIAELHSVRVVAFLPTFCCSKIYASFHIVYSMLNNFVHRQVFHFYSIKIGCIVYRYLIYVLCCLERL